MITKKKPNNSPNLTFKIAYMIVIVVTILLGLATRKFSALLPVFIAENGGDMLWAMMVYFGFRFLLRLEKLFLAIWFSILFCFGIEFSQLYQEEWINQIRGTLLGALILGKGFLSADLVRYTAGIIIAVIIDKSATLVPTEVNILLAPK